MTVSCVTSVETGQSACHFTFLCSDRSAVPTHTMFAYSVDFPLRHIQDPASQRLTWSKPPLNVLVIRKIGDETLLGPFKELCSFLVEVGYTEATLVVDLQARKLQALLLPFQIILLYHSFFFFFLVTQILTQLFPPSGETSDGLCGEESCGRWLSLERWLIFSHS